MNSPLDLLNQRQLGFLPPHFVSTEFEEYNSSTIKTWIITNLTGRFCIEDKPAIINNTLQMSSVVAFEDPKELTYFLLACPYNRRYYD